jgi:23S rRNA (cytidine1920-2'-O)/16S rRNA (cytidine1409-2'-O)-methyltransferase
VELVRRGLTASRELARDEIEKGNVLVAGAPALKASRLVAPEEPLVLRHDRRRFVSRGGEKLDYALGQFDVSVSGKVVLDAGASTGGFTDCLLQRGASAVIAVDVGHGQLHERLRTDSRVRVVDRTNVRHLSPADLPSTTPVQLVVADLSFISLRVVAAALLELAAPDADLVMLVKPQFEAGRAAVAKGKGVVSDPSVWRSTVLEVRDAFAALCAVIMSVVVSPILGTEGNAEFLVHLRRGDGISATGDFDAELDDAIAMATDMRQKTVSHSFAEGG